MDWDSRLVEDVLSVSKVVQDRIEDVSTRQTEMDGQTADRYLKAFDICKEQLGKKRDRIRSELEERGPGVLAEWERDMRDFYFGRQPIKKPVDSIASHAVMGDKAAHRIELEHVRFPG